jgi:hypothetical protein
MCTIFCRRIKQLTWVQFIRSLRQTVKCSLSLVSAYCLQKDSLDNLCGQITGDATLFSMFRSDAGPTECPFRGGPPFTFTYNRGSGECSSPVSKVDSCTDESRLLLRYQACPDVHGTESTGQLARNTVMSLLSTLTYTRASTFRISYYYIE